MQVTIIATDQNSTEHLIIEADGADEETAATTTLAQVPQRMARRQLPPHLKAIP